MLNRVLINNPGQLFTVLLQSYQVILLKAERFDEYVSNSLNW